MGMICGSAEFSTEHNTDDSSARAGYAQSLRTLQALLWLRLVLGGIISLIIMLSHTLRSCPGTIYVSLSVSVSLCVSMPDLCKLSFVALVLYIMIYPLSSLTHLSQKS